MARRNGRPGAYLMSDDYTGFTRYSSQLKRDYWGNYAQKPLKRNLQEVASPLNDPQPVNPFRASNYESIPTCAPEIAPTYIGLTNIPTPQNNMAFQVLNLNPSIPDMAVGCTFVIR